MRKHSLFTSNLKLKNVDCMADRTRFGPAGVPPIFRILGARMPDVPRFLQEENLDAFEYAAVRWGQKPQMKQEDARDFGFEARQNDIMVSMHGSYYVNLCGKKEIIEASKKRLVACATAANWMGAYVLVFHTGFYGRLEKKCAFKICVNALKDIVSTMRSLGIQKVKLGPETMGKISQVGSLDEILTICEEVEQTHLVIDWAHMHARRQGRFRKVEDIRAVAEEIERRLGTEAMRTMHCHFSKIEYTIKGERRHHILDDVGYGPDFAMLAEVMDEFKMRPVIICETPLLDVDAMKMRDTYNRIVERHRTSIS
jgi:deoxyribonuclease IV